jgi:hypothetical protein
MYMGKLRPTDCRRPKRSPWESPSWLHVQKLSHSYQPFNVALLAIYTSYKVKMRILEVF